MLGEWNCSVFRCCHCDLKHVSLAKNQPSFCCKAFQTQRDTQGPCTRPWTTQAGSDLAPSVTRRITLGTKWYYTEVSWNGGTPKSSILTGFALHLQTIHFGDSPLLETRKSTRSESVSAKVLSERSLRHLPNQTMIESDMQHPITSVSYMWVPEMDIPLVIIHFNKISHYKTNHFGDPLFLEIPTCILPNEHHCELVLVSSCFRQP